MYWLIPLAFVVLFELVADILAKEWSLRTQVWWLGAAALVAYVVCNSFWLLALKNGSGLGRGAVVFSISSALLAVIIGLFWYGEKLSPLQATGIFIGLIALVLIFWE